MYTYQDLLEDLQKLTPEQLTQQVKADPGHGWNERNVTSLDVYATSYAVYPVTLQMD